jgi:hypothetical protein
VANTEYHSGCLVCSVFTLILMEGPVGFEKNKTHNCTA